MQMILCPSKRLLPAVLILVLVIAFSCGSKVSHEGTYVAGGGDASADAVIVLELKENGKGCWKKEDEEVPFSWKVHRGGQLRLHLKLGGIVLGKIADGTIEIVLPGTEKLIFRKK
jgi:hypothetical protein